MTTHEIARLERFLTDHLEARIISTYVFFYPEQQMTVPAGVEVLSWWIDFTGRRSYVWRQAAYAPGVVDLVRLLNETSRPYGVAWFLRRYVRNVSLTVRDADATFKF